MLAILYDFNHVYTFNAFIGYPFNLTLEGLLWLDKIRVINEMVNTTVTITVIKVSQL